MDELKFDAWMKLLMVLGERGSHRNVTELFVAVKGSYSHTYTLCKLLKEKGLVKVEKKGRVNLVSLTLPGLSVASHLRSIKNYFGGVSEELLEVGDDE